MANLKPTQIVTGEVRISYEHLLKPYASQPNEEPKYSATLLIPKSDAATMQRINMAIQTAIQEASTGKWGMRIPQPPLPIHDGDGLREDNTPYSEECKGHWVVTASSKHPQEVVDINGNPIINATEIYSGMYARVCVNFFGYSAPRKKGIGCGLGPVQKIRDGEPLGGGRTNAQDAFSAQPAPAYPAQPAYPSQPTYAPPAPTYPAYPAQPIYAPQVPPPATYVPPQYQQPTAQPGYAPQPQLDPITGMPVGGIAGI